MVLKKFICFMLSIILMSSGCICADASGITAGGTAVYNPSKAAAKKIVKIKKIITE